MEPSRSCDVRRSAVAICDTGLMSDPNVSGSVPPDEPFMPPTPEPGIAPVGHPDPATRYAPADRGHAHAAADHADVG